MGPPCAPAAATALPGCANEYLLRSLSSWEAFWLGALQIECGTSSQSRMSPHCDLTYITPPDPTSHALYHTQIIKIATLYTQKPFHLDFIIATILNKETKKKEHKSLSGKVSCE